MARTKNEFTLDRVCEILNLPMLAFAHTYEDQYLYECIQILKKEQPELSSEQMEELAQKALEKEMEEEYIKWENKNIKNIEFLAFSHKLDFSLLRTAKGVKYYQFAPTTNWKSSAQKIANTINGVGMFEINSVDEWRKTENCKSFKQLVLKRLGHMKSYLEVYGVGLPHPDC